MRPSPSRSLLPFDVLADAFTALTTDPTSLAVDGAALGDGLPDRWIPLDELRSRLLLPTCPYETRDAAINALLAKAQTEGRSWTVGLIGVLLPGLRRAASPLTAACPHRTADIQADVLTGFLVAVAATPVGRPRVAARLTWAARRNAERLVRVELIEQGRPGHDPVPAAPPHPYGHPDLVLARSVSAQVISAQDAGLIGATRLGEMSLAEAANRLGIDYDAARKRRRRAETALAAWIADGAEDFVRTTPTTGGSSDVGRPRQGRRPQ